MSELDKVVRVRKYTRFPGPRYIELGPYSGEWFRTEILKPAVDQFGEDVIVDLDGVLGYGSSFLDESFAGLIRQGISEHIVRKIAENVISKDDPDLKGEIRSYIEEQLANSKIG